MSMFKKGKNFISDSSLCCVYCNGPFEAFSASKDASLDNDGVLMLLCDHCLKFQISITKSGEKQIVPITVDAMIEFKSMLPKLYKQLVDYKILTEIKRYPHV